ncbi:Cilia- and flagella-associated protein 91 [Bagarius yarrelli]|uniref:Cilia- and flagella-associated protein 91 n=1 Tax=Bagarius yarrelli TaxID=175774 RepID=A0A556VWU1_BAGYA|nr:Cilia- and flagella-associated protein 91 [Bagarius yarrelli]
MKVPEFNSMFSNLPHHPSFTLQLNAPDPVPSSIDRRWRGHAEQRRETLQTLAGMLPGVRLHKPKSGDVTGADRWKFFQRPLIPFAQRIPPNVIFALPKGDPQNAQQEGSDWMKSSSQRTVAVQTDYRDSETQTDPYSPEYVIRPGETIPEVLTLASFTWALRKLIAKRKTVEGKLVRRDIVTDHLDYGSQIYAPLLRHGVIPDRQSQQTVKSHFLNTYQGHQSVHSVYAQCRAFIEHALRDKKGQVEEKKPLRFLYKVEKPPPRPPTPEVDVPPEGDEEKELAVIFLQKLLRGRSIQNQMLDGVEKQLELIQELRTTHSLQQDEQELQRADKQVTLALQSEREISENRMSQIQSYIDGLSGAVIGDMLDFLSKELVRLQEERRIHAFMLLAERDRRIREAEESGRRQVEERRRREEDEIFRQVVKVHQATVDLYLEDVILGSIDETAEAQAREEIHHMAEELNNITYAMEETMDNMQAEAIVAQLVHSFLLPEVHKSTARDRVKQSQRRHLKAARNLIHDTGSSSTNARPLSPVSRACTSMLSQIVEQVTGTATSDKDNDKDQHQETKYTD